MKRFNLVLLVLVSVFISGCSFSKNNVVKSISKATYVTACDLSDLKNLKELQKRRVIVTSLVDVNNFEQTSNFGRLYSDSIITDLRNKDWDVVDFRGQDVVTKSKTGEFYLNREKLVSFPEDSFVFVGTYGEYKKGLLINQRLIHMLDNQVITASSLLLKDKGESLELSKIDNCKEVGCKKDNSIKSIKKVKKEESFMVNIVEDDCTNAKDCLGDKK